MKKRALSCLFAAGLILTAGGSLFAGGGQAQGEGGAASQAVKRITFGTAGTAGALYPMGVAMSETITNHVPGLAATGEATAASVENIRNLHEGKMEIGISQTEVASYAYYGQLDYAGNPFTDIRALFATIYSYLQVFVPADSGINSIADFKGKAIGVGPAGSGGELAVRGLLSVYGLSYKDVSPQFIPDGEAVSALKDRKIAGLIATHPLKSAAMTELTTSMKVKLLPITDEQFFKTFGAYSKYTVPAGTYKDIDYEVVIPRSRVIVLGSTKSGLSDTDYYNIVKAVWNNRDEWKSCNASVERESVLEHALEEIDIPLHPGAIKYFEEIGLKIPDKLRK
jgi:TRAP transporter TAXI family solute receptor